MSKATKNRNARKKTAKRRQWEEKQMTDRAITELEMEAPSRIHKHVIGRKGVNINKLSTEYPNIHVEFIVSKIKIKGPPEQVEKAREQLDGIVKDYVKRLAFIDMIVNPIHYSEIIGPERSVSNYAKEFESDALDAMETDVMNHFAVSIKKIINYKP